MSVWWSIGLAVVSLLASWTVGNRWRVGWIVGIGQQCAWIPYAVISSQWGFLASSLAFLCMNIRNYRKWKRLDRKEATRSECQCVRERV